MEKKILYDFKLPGTLEIAQITVSCSIAFATFSFFFGFHSP